MRKLLLTLALCVTACGDDEDAPLDQLDGSMPDAGGPDAKVDLDAKADLDAKVDLDAARDATADSSVDGGSCELDQTYRYTRPGGLSTQVSSYSISSRGVYKRDTVPSNIPGVPDAGSASCMSMVSCERLSALRGALTDADVSAAWGDGQNVLGEDPRPYDGQILLLERTDGKKIAVGVDCRTETPCTAVPAGVRTLRDLIDQIDQEQASSGGCARN